MQTRDDFVMYEIGPTLGDFREDFDLDAIMDGLVDGGIVEFDAHDGYRWAAGANDDPAFWDVVREHDVSGR